MKPSIRWLRQYAPMELAPMARRGNDQSAHPSQSITAQKNARNKRQMPPEKRTQLGVQIRFTTGQMPISPRLQPSARLMVPATRSQTNLNQGGRSRFKIPPAISPRIIVASVGMKLSVA